MEERYIPHIPTAINKGGTGGDTQAHRSTEGHRELRHRFTRTLLIDF